KADLLSEPVARLAPFPACAREKPAMSRSVLCVVSLMVCVGASSGQAPAEKKLPFRVLKVAHTAPAAPRVPRADLVVQSGHNHAARAVAFSPDRALLATSSNDDTVKLWDLQLGREVRTFACPTGPVFDVRFSPDGRQVCGASWGGPIYIWDANDGRLLSELQG